MNDSIMSESRQKQKPRIATAALCGCFGCHMSLLDIDERFLKLVELVEFDRTPLTDMVNVISALSKAVLPILKM